MFQVSQYFLSTGPLSAITKRFRGICIYRSSHQRCSMKKGVLRNFTKFTGKQLCQSLFFNKVAGLRPATLLKKRLWHSCFPVNFVKFLRTPFLQNTSGRLLPYISFYLSLVFMFSTLFPQPYLINSIFVTFYVGTLVTCPI